MSYTDDSAASPPPNMLAEMKTMLDQQTFCDVTFVLGDKRFLAHRVVLAARSRVFKTMFLSGMKEQEHNIVEISNTTAEVFQEFLNYLYSGKVAELGKMVDEMIVVADFYDVSDLKTMCQNFMSKSLSEDSVVRYIILADKLNCRVLKQEALEFIRSSARVFERAILAEDVTTMVCLKEILSNNQTNGEWEGAYYPHY